MAQFLGLDPDEVRALATQLDSSGTELENLISTLKSKLDATTWVGSDRTRFEGDWDSTLSSSLRNVANALHDAANTARGNADQQETASS
jgi:WXG100 family type VII secretion target